MGKKRTREMEHYLRVGSTRVCFTRACLHVGAWAHVFVLCICVCMYFLQVAFKNNMALINSELNKVKVILGRRNMKRVRERQKWAFPTPIYDEQIHRRHLVSY